MKNALRVMLVLLSLSVFVFATSAMAEDFFVVKQGAKMAVTDKKPEDVKSVVKGPFKTKAEAEAALKAAAKPKPPTTGC